jgi:hypothetical protein
MFRCDAAGRSLSAMALADRSRDRAEQLYFYTLPLDISSLLLEENLTLTVLEMCQRRLLLMLDAPTLIKGIYAMPRSRLPVNAMATMVNYAACQIARIPRSRLDLRNLASSIMNILFIFLPSRWTSVLS